MIKVLRNTDNKGYRRNKFSSLSQFTTQWYMTSVMGTNRSIYLFTPERPRDLSARAPGPAPQDYYNIITRPQICLRKKLRKTINPREHCTRQLCYIWFLLKEPRLHK